MFLSQAKKSWRDCFHVNTDLRFLRFLATSNRKIITKNLLHKDKKKIKLSVNYRVALKIWRSLFLRIGVFWYFAGTNFSNCHKLVFFLSIFFLYIYIYLFSQTITDPLKLHNRTNYTLQSTYCNTIHRDHTILRSRERVNKGTKKKWTIYPHLLLLSALLSYAILLGNPLLTNPA